MCARTLSCVRMCKSAHVCACLCVCVGTCVCVCVCTPCWLNLLLHFGIAYHLVDELQKEVFISDWVPRIKCLNTLKNYSSSLSITKSSSLQNNWHLCYKLNFSLIFWWTNWVCNLFESWQCLTELLRWKAIKLTKTSSWCFSPSEDFHRL